MDESLTGRCYTWLDHLIVRGDQFLRLFSQGFPSSRSNPAADVPEDTLSPAEQQLSARLMRVNHSGEICAQALYEGQALTTPSTLAQATLHQAAAEERDHLSWCQQRLQELNSHTSYLNPLWYLGSFALGAAVGCWGDRISLGFVHATESQVERHLQTHLQWLPKTDVRSRTILQAMLYDEIHHGHTAIEAGGEPLPGWCENIMYFAAKPMTILSKWI